MKTEYAINKMKDWIEYEKVNKDKINNAEELIEIQEKVLKALEDKDSVIEFLKIIRLMHESKLKRFELLKSKIKNRITELEKEKDENQNYSTTVAIQTELKKLLEEK